MSNGSGPIVWGSSLVREVFSSAADLQLDLENKTLTVQLHRLASPSHDEELKHLCEELTATETIYPGIDLRLIYRPVGATSIP